MQKRFVYFKVLRVKIAYIRKKERFWYVFLKVINNRQDPGYIIKM